MLVAQIAEMPRPQKSLCKDEQCGSDDGEADGRRRVAQVVSGAQQEY